MIQLEQVTKTYPKASRPSLDNVSVAIEKGEAEGPVYGDARAMTDDTVRGLVDW